MPLMTMGPPTDTWKDMTWKGTPTQPAASPSSRRPTTSEQGDTAGRVPTGQSGREQDAAFMMDRPVGPVGGNVTKTTNMPFCERDVQISAVIVRRWIFFKAITIWVGGCRGCKSVRNYSLASVGKRGASCYKGKFMQRQHILNYSSHGHYIITRYLYQKVLCISELPNCWQK